MKDLYTVTLDAKQVARALEEYVLRGIPDKGLTARAEGLAQLMGNAGFVHVRVSTKRARASKATK